MFDRNALASVELPQSFTHTCDKLHLAGNLLERHVIWQPGEKI